MPTSSWFVTALEARNNIRKDIAVHGEICEIEREVLQAVWRGDYETVVSTSLMTAQSDISNQVFTVDALTNTLSVPAHGYSMGDLVTVSSTGQLPPPLLPLCAYYVIVVDADHIRLATTRANALSGTSISIDITLGVTSVTVTDPGSGYLVPPGVRPQGGDPQTPATLQAVLQTHGAAHSVSVLEAGSAFTDAPQVQVVSLGSGATVGDVKLKVVQVQVNTGGTGYTTGDLLFLSGGDGVSAVFRVTQTVNTVVTQVIIEHPGSYVVLPPLLAAAVTSDQSGVACTLNLSMGVSQIEIQSAGTNYVNPPLVTISGGGGTGATATATINAGAVSQIVVTQSGSGYTFAPTVTLTTGAGAQAQAQLQPTGVGSISITDAGSTFTDVPQVVLNSRGIDATAHDVTLKVVSAQLINGGINYSQGDLLLVSGGAYVQACVIQVLTTNLAGQILTFNIVNPGIYTAPPLLDFNNMLGGTGVGASFNLGLGVHTIQVLNGGVGYVSPPHVRIEGDGTGAQALSQTDGDQVTLIQVTAPGMGYRSVPTVILDSGSGAQAVATLLPTSVDVIQVLNPGSGYVTPPDVILQGGGGQGATAEAIIVNGSVDQIVITNPGNNYTQAPEVIVTGNAVAQALLTPTSLDTIQVTSSGINYTSSPLVAFSQGDALAQAHLNPTGILHVHIQTGGANYVTDPVLQFAAGEGQLGEFVNPITRVNRSFGVQQVNVITSGTGYQSEPQIQFTSPTPAGSPAQAICQIGSGSGVFTIKPYAPSRDYFLVWRNQAPSSDLLRRPYADQISAVIKYFQDLGYTITPELNPQTQNTFQWRILW